jgi:hypothetical protein
MRSLIWLLTRNMAASSTCVSAGDEPEAASSLIWIGAVPVVAIQFFGGGVERWGGPSRKNYCNEKVAAVPRRTTWAWTFVMCCGGSRESGLPTADASKTTVVYCPGQNARAGIRQAPTSAIFLRASSFRSWFRRLPRWIAAVPWRLRRTGRWVAIPDTY